MRWLNAVVCAVVFASQGSAGLPGEVAGQSWPQWRGPQRDGTIGGGPWPSQLDETTVVRQWRVPLGPGYSGPLVVGDRVFVTETQGKKREVVRALDRNSGQQIWQADWEGAISVPFFAKSNGDWIRATPAYADGRLYVAGMRDVLVCLDAQTGRELWRVDFVEQVGSPLPAFGFVSSPLLHGDSVYVQAGAGFARLDRLTGQILWRTLENRDEMYGSAFSSPYLATLAGQLQMVVQTREELAGVDLQTGRALWQQVIPAFRGMNILTPTTFGDGVLTSSYGGRTFLHRVVKDGEGFRVEEAWSSKLQGYMSSPVFIEGHAYLHLRNQRFACIDLNTGEEKWVSRPYGKYWSLVAQGDRILALDESGELHLIQANPEKLVILGSYPISDDPTWAHLAVCDDQVFIRELQAMAVYRWTSGSSDPPPAPRAAPGA